METTVTRMAAVLVNFVTPQTTSTQVRNPARPIPKTFEKIYPRSFSDENRAAPRG